MTTTLTFSVASHNVPADNAVHRNSIWSAPKSAYNAPYLLTTDPFGVATHLWTVADRSLEHVCSLNPPLPAGDVRFAFGATDKPGLFVVAFNSRTVRPGVVLRVYDLNQDGEMTHETVSPNHSMIGGMDMAVRISGNFVAASLRGSDWIIVAYKLADDLKLEEAARLVPEGKTDSLSILHLSSDGSVVIGWPVESTYHISRHHVSAEPEPPPLRLSTTNASHLTRFLSLT
jgi:hypothetical protein